MCVCAIRRPTMHESVRFAEKAENLEMRARAMNSSHTDTHKMQHPKKNST